MPHQPLLFLPLLPFFISFVFMKSCAGNNNSSIWPHCPASKCGNIEVKYPFWIKSNDTAIQYCGYEGFGLDCTPSSVPGNYNLTLHLPPVDFHVQNINYADYKLTLVDADATTNLSCPRPRHNLTLEDLPLNYTTQDLNLTFYFNCTVARLPFSAYPVDCLKSGGNMSFVSLETGTNSDPDWFKFCEEKVVVTVTKEEIEGVINWNANGIWESTFAGFVLDWYSGFECAGCENSGGRCGHNNTTTEEFLCFCNDGTITHDHCKGGGSNLRLKIGIGFGAAAGSALILCVIFFVYQRRHKNRDSGSTLISRDISSYSSSVIDPERASGYLGVHIFAYTELEEATNCFDPNKELGDGGFGTVYKGKLRDGREVAVKRLYESNFKRVEHFRNEVEILTRLRHRNLVSLYGCTSRHCRELLLVYEYIPNGTIADHLHGPLARPGSLPWSTRMNIAIETASALSYLHASDVIHRDVKTNNILLDNNFCVKVADFGLSRLFPINATHVSTAPQGTPGYVDPEYHQCYHLTDKSDVFSFGVVLIELISSMPAVDITRHRHEINLSNIAVHRIQNHLLHELVDDNLGYGSDYKLTAMIEDVAELAFQCLQYERDMRPTMQEVLQALLEIQNKDYNAEKKEEMDNQADDVVLLKINQLTSSPDSILTNSVSSSTTTSTST
ncbi:LEAF RUST 10 DISEASE-RESISTANCEUS RECEPTOR-LIKE PROTEIN KINASE-like 1.2 isoform X1 [Coffea arabica]|uniref:non-specific serine/threonine protein kinase n=1 Tax=Coffea arabica TaxID=13443 RepID=A0A6P6X6G8_COFAR